MISLVQNIRKSKTERLGGQEGREGERLLLVQLVQASTSDPINSDEDSKVTEYKKGSGVPNLWPN